MNFLSSFLYRSFILLFLLCPMLLQGQFPRIESKRIEAASRIKEAQASRVWVDSVMNDMSLDQKIGQLFMLATFSNKDESHYRSIEKLIKTEHLGGLIFMQGTPQRQLELVNRYQAQSQIPMLIAQDAEWGMAMRLKGVSRFPYQMTLGAIQNDSLLYQLGRQMALELRAAGVQVSFSPVADINNNPLNPVINYRSFGENKYNIARKSIMMMRGLQDHGVMACGKHFPGHGDTETDSHMDLPLIPHSRARLDSIELYPFSRLVEAGIQSVMVAHLYIPSLDDTPRQASTLSSRIVTGLLRRELGFRGLVFTDALNMHGVTKYYQPGEVALKAFLAGNDILLFPQDIPKARRMIRQALEQGTVTRYDLESRVRRILQAKYQLQLHQWNPLSPQKLEEVIADPEADLLRKRLYAEAITLVKNERRLLPLKSLDQRRIAYVQVGGGSGNRFDHSLRKYADVSLFYLRKGFTTGEKTKLFRDLKGFDTVIMGIFGMNQRASKNYGVGDNLRALMAELKQLPVRTVVSVFGNPYALQFFEDPDAVIQAYEDRPEAALAAAAAIFGGQPVLGKLPVEVSPQYREGNGLIIPQAVRFGFSRPEEQRMDSGQLLKIDSLANHYIRKGAMPGCAIMVVKGNDIVYEKGFGRMEYDPTTKAIDPYLHTYDLASITKVVATTLCCMHLVEKKKLDLDLPISYYLPELKGTNKAKLTVRRLLQHNAGLPGWVAFYEETFFDREKKILDPNLYQYRWTPRHTSLIAPSLYANPNLHDWVWEQVKETQVRRTQRVRYSDIGMILLWRIVESISGEGLDAMANRLFFRPLGMDHTFFQPFNKGKAEYCPPTEADTLWRQAIIQGFVHDPASAILGGICGHAGLFANIYDLGKVLLMLKNGGVYGNRRFFKPETIRSFTRKQLSYSRRGLGWDKPEDKSSKRAPTPVSEFASDQTFGHTGFTGTCVWVDPVYDLIYVFLSNRTYPFPKNRLLLREHVREKIMDQAYYSIFRFKANSSTGGRSRDNTSG